MENLNRLLDLIDTLEKQSFNCWSEDSKNGYLTATTTIKNLINELIGKVVNKGNAGKYVIIDLRNMDFMKNERGEINYYDTAEDASLTCGMYEFENAWVCKLIYNHIEEF